MQFIKMLISVIMMIVLMGCIQNPVQPNDPKFAPVTANTLQAPKSNTGGIFLEGYATNLWEDQRARRVGDIITVLLEENTVASKSNSTSISKESSHETPVPVVFGKARGFAENSFGSQRDFGGAADADQSNNLSGSITATVSEVLPNGTLVVRGEKWLTLGQGEEFIRITGMIRPSDINPDNTIQSTKIADARITYAGRGDLADSGKMGWLSKFFNGLIWPM